MAIGGRAGLLTLICRSPEQCRDLDKAWQETHRVSLEVRGSVDVRTDLPAWMMGIMLGRSSREKDGEMKLGSGLLNEP